MRLLLISILPVIFFLNLPDLKAQCFSANSTFGDGENVTFEVMYNWGPIWVNAGLVTFSAKKEILSGKETFHLKSTGKTYASYDFLFKVRDYYDSWIDPATFRSLSFQRMIYEGGYTLVNTIRFDQANQIAYSSTKSNNNPVRKDTLPSGPCAFDMLSAVYYTRTLDLRHLSPDLRIPVTVIVDDSLYHIYIRYIGKETLADQNGQKYRCIKFSAKMIEGTIFRGDEDVLVWVTDDENKIPVYIEAKILVGTVRAYLKEMTGVRNPVTSLVK
jgi:hypothetical protein